MTQYDKRLLLTGMMPAPAGRYRISVADGALSAESGRGVFSFQAADIASVVCFAALPAKGGGFQGISLRFRSRPERTLMLSEYYRHEVRAMYAGLGRKIAAFLEVPFEEEDLAADA